MNTERFRARLTGACRGAALLLLTLVALASLLPLYWMATGSLKLQQNAMSVPPEWFPQHPTFQNYQKLLFGSKPVLRWFLNSVVTASAIAATAVFTSTMAGYAFGKKRFPGRSVLFGLIVVTMILPREVTLVPLLVLMRQLGWVDSYLALVAPFICYPFGIFLVRQFMQAVPNDLLDAASLDGAGEWATFARVVLPLARPAIAAVGIFAFVSGWNEYLWQLMLLNREEMLTLPVGVSKLVSSLTSFDMGVAMAGATFAFLPMLIVYLAFQDYFVRGITIGAVKG